MGASRRAINPASFSHLALLTLLVATVVALVQPPAALAAGYPSWWVQTFQPTHLWSGSDKTAADYGAIPQGSYLLVVTPQKQSRLYVYVPWTHGYAYVDAASVGPSGPPPAAPPPTPTAAPQSPAIPGTWTGRVVANGALIRSGPTVLSPIVRTDPAGTSVNVVAWVSGDQIVYNDWTWAKLIDGTYVYGEALQIVPTTSPPPPPANHPNGQWIDVNTLQQTAVAYDGNTPVHLAIASTGSPGWETPVGTFAILRRVANETMSSSTLVGLDATQQAEANYYLTDVLYTQYFDDRADGLHDNYWLPASRFGMPHSHGCVGLQLADADWFWNWASFGTPVVIHNG